MCCSAGHSGGDSGGGPVVVLRFRYDLAVQLVMGHVQLDMGELVGCGGKIMSVTS